MRVTSDTQKIQSSNWLKWRAFLSGIGRHFKRSADTLIEITVKFVSENNKYDSKAIQDRPLATNVRLHESIMLPPNGYHERHMCNLSPTQTYSKAMQWNDTRTGRLMRPCDQSSMLTLFVNHIPINLKIRPEATCHTNCYFLQSQECTSPYFSNRNTSAIFGFFSECTEIVEMLRLLF